MMTRAASKTLLLLACILLRWNTASAQTSPELAWDESSSSPVTGYAVTFDGARVDYALAPLGAGGTCGCAIPLPFSGGRHTIVVSAYNNFGETPSATLTVGPAANAGGPYTGQAGTSVAVDGSGSGTPIGNIVSYAWNWGDGTSSVAASPQASHTFAAGGTFTIVLTVT